MTTTVIVQAHCDQSRQVVVKITDGAIVCEQFMLQDGEEAAPVVYDNRCISVREELKIPVAVVAPDPIMQFFAYAHLPAHLQSVSAPFGQLAQHIVSTLPRNPERTVALRKLLEAKDAAVRALLFKDGAP